MTADKEAIRLSRVYYKCNLLEYRVLYIISVDRLPVLIIINILGPTERALLLFIKSSRVVQH